MLRAVLEVAGLIVVFLAGTVVGDLQKVTVDRALAAVAQAEAQAKAVLDKIIAHKAT